MGIDNGLLSIIFGEALPEYDDLLTTPPVHAARSIIATNHYDQSSLEFRLLERIARELRILVNQISDRPGAFPTYLQSQQTPIPYVGLPETARDTPIASRRPRIPILPQHPSQPVTREKWELKMVFRYLRSRFTYKFRPSPTGTSPILDFNTAGNLAPRNSQYR
jgi:hypothetical protein